MSLHSADPKERRKLRWLAVLGLLLIAITFAALLWYRERLAATAAVNAEDGYLMAVGFQRGLLFLIAAQFFALSWYVIKRALRVLNTQRFPLQESRTLTSIRVRTGAEAVALGRLGVAASLLCLLLGLAAIAAGFLLQF